MRIGVFGLGTIGSIWARHWRADGHEVRVWNRTPKPEFPGFSSDPETVARDADLIAIVVSDAKAVEKVLATIQKKLNKRTVVAQHSTIGFDETRRFAKWVEQKKAQFLDMPFSGSRGESEKRQTLFFVGEKENVLERVEPVYHRISQGIFRVGDIGQGTALKLALNLFAANLYQGLAEGYALAEKAGVPGEIFFSALAQHSCRSALTDAKREKILEKEYTSNFSLQNMHKDLHLIMKFAKKISQPIPQTQTLIKSYEKAKKMGLSESDFSSVIETLRPARIAAQSAAGRSKK
ncbi:MAG: NAD(P)-dependent oxidoreductase [Verrucomicrobiae bacterium]|nr:NAD(P)-dependent oxidoreductase [Verrucomicrobiae bacterium]